MSHARFCADFDIFRYTVYISYQFHDIDFVPKRYQDLLRLSQGCLTPVSDKHGFFG